MGPQYSSTTDVKPMFELQKAVSSRRKVSETVWYVDLGLRRSLFRPSPLSLTYVWSVRML